MANKNDVELSVKISKGVDKAIDQITAALEKLTAAQGKVGSSAEITGSSLGKVVSEIKTLTSTIDKEKAFDRMAADIISANNALKSQEAQFSKNREQYAANSKQLETAAAAQGKLKTQVAASRSELEAQRKELAESKKQFDAFNKTIAEQGTQKKYMFPTSGSAASEQIGKAKEEYDRLSQSVATNEAAHDSLEKQLYTLNSAYKSLAGEQDRLERSMRKQSASIESQKASINVVSQSATVAEASYKQLVSAQNEAEQSANRVSIAQRRAALEIRNVASASLADNRQSFAGPIESVTKLREELLKAGPPTRQQAEALKALSDAATRAKGAPAELSTAIAHLSREMVSTNATSASLNTAMANVRAAMERSAGVARDLGTATSNVNNMLRQQAQAIQQSANATRATASADAQAATNKRALAAAIREYNDGARRSLDFTQRIRGQVLSLAAAYIGLHNSISQIGAVVSAYQSLEAAQNRLGAVFNQDQTRVAAELDFLRRNADRLGISFQVLADEYGKFAVATQGTNLAGQETRKIFLAVAEAGRVNKLSIDNMQGTYLALTQMVSKGKVQSEELRRQLGDRLPGAFQIMAKALGVSTAKLDEMMKKGEVTSDALSKFADELNRRFGNQLEASLTSTTTAIGRFQNQAYQTQLLFAKSGFIDAFTESLNRMSEAMAGPKFQSFVQKMSQLLAGLINVLGVIPDHADALTIAFTAFMGLKIGGYVVALAANFQSLVPKILAAKTATDLLTLRTQNSRTAILAASAATRSWGLALSVLGGPIGIAITAISVAIGYWATRTDTATAAMNAHQKVVDAVTNAYDKAGKGAKDWSKIVTETTRTEARSNLVGLRKEYDELTTSMRNSIGFLERQANSPGSRVLAGDRVAIKDLVSVLERLKSRTVNIADFRKELDRIDQTTQNAGIKDLILNLAKTADEAGTTGKKLREAELILTMLTGTAKEAAEAERELMQSFKAGSGVIDDGTAALDKYNEALNNIKKNIPRLVGELANLKTLKEIDDAANTILSVGPPTPENQKLISEAYSAAADKANQRLIKGAPEVADAYIQRIIAKESGGNASIKTGNGRSTAAGLGQFTDPTWIRYFTKTFPEAAAKLMEAGKTQGEAAILQYKTGENNRDTQIKVLKTFTDDNRAMLLKAGITPDITNTYLAHFLGPGDAIKVILANPKDLLSGLVNDRSRAANPEIFGPKGRGGQTAGSLQAWAAQLMGGGAALQNTGLTKAETEAVAQAKKFKDELDKQNKALDERNNKIRMTTTQAEIANALAATGLTLESAAGQALAARITESRKQIDAEEQVNALMAQRQLIQEQIKFQQEQTGDVGMIQQLRTELANVNTELSTAIQNAIRMWTELGGPQADAAILKLQQTGLTVEKNAVGVMNWDKIIESGMQNIASNSADALGSVAENIWGLVDGTVSWGDALSNIGSTFASMVGEILLGIAKMILQETILLGIRTIMAAYGYYGPGPSGSSGGTGAGVLPSLLHTGGIAGANGGRSAAISMASVGSMMRYHTGGIAGERPLADNEVMTVLEEGEEVLTQDDPRHINNAGQSNGNNGGQIGVKIVNAFDAASVMAEAMTTSAGQKAFVNMVKSNKAVLKGILG